MDVLKQLYKIVNKRSKDYDDKDFLIRGQWAVQLMFKPNIYERTFKYGLIVTQTRSQGVSYCLSGNPIITEEIMGGDARIPLKDRRCLNISLLDSAFSVFNDKPHEKFEITGTSDEKSTKRANIIVNEIKYHMNKLDNSKSKSIVNVGVVGNILKQLSNSGFDCKATDFDPDLIGKKINNVPVYDGEKYTMKLIAESDCALITGMTLATNTLSQILDIAQKNNTKIIMFNETGSWFGHELVTSFPIDGVISEKFPFYIFEGNSTIYTHRKK